jgi:HAD superfamily hydrolase (TIGR01509 family)
MLKTVVFDLDGVVADSSGSLHYASWKYLFEDVLNISGFTVDHYEEHVSGRQRDAGLANYLRYRAALSDTERLLEIADDPAQIEKYSALKQARVQALLDDPAFEIPRFEDTVAFIKELRSRGIKTTIASASENTPQVLEKTGMSDLFDALAYGKTATIDGKQIELASKPAPDVFTASRRMVGAEAAESAGVEDAGQGIEAIRADGMMSIGIERGGRENIDLRRSKPDVMLTSFEGYSVDKLLEQFNTRSQG